MLQREIFSQAAKLVLIGLVWLLAPWGARFLLAADFRPALFLVLLDQYAWVAYVLGLILIAGGVYEYSQRLRR